MNNLCRVWLLLLIVFCGGCAHYKSGTGGVPLKSVYVAPIKNNSTCPKISAPLTTLLVYDLQQKTSIKVEKNPRAEAQLSIEVVNFSQKIAACNPHDTSKALSWEVKIGAACTLKGRSGEAIIDHQVVEVSMDLDMQEDFHTARDQAIPSLAARLAREISSLVAHAW